MTADEMRQDWTSASKWVWECMEAKGFHDTGDTPGDVMLGVRLALCHTEAAEATQEIKRHWTDTPLGLRDKVAEELADTTIRLLDLAVCHEIDLDWTTARLRVEVDNIPRRYELINSLNRLHVAIAGCGSDDRNLSVAIHYCDAICKVIGRDLFIAIEKKMAKNMARPMNYGTPKEAK